MRTIAYLQLNYNIVINILALIVILQLIIKTCLYSVLCLAANGDFLRFAALCTTCTLRCASQKPAVFAMAWRDYKQVCQAFT